MMAWPNDTSDATQATDPDIVAGTSTTPMLASPAQLKLAAQTHGGVLNPLPDTFIDTTTTSDTLNINEHSAGNAMIVPPATSTYAKTLRKKGASESKVYSKSRLGYVRLNNTTPQTIKIGNANLSLTQRHCVLILHRMPQSNIDGYAGEYDLIKTSQNGLSGNPLFRMGVGGAGSNAGGGGILNKWAFAGREGYTAGVSSTKYEVSHYYAGGLTAPYSVEADFWNRTNTANIADNKWVWIAVMGVDASDLPDIAGLRVPFNMSHDGSSLGVSMGNRIILAHGLHEMKPHSSSLSSRWNYNPQWTMGTTDGMNPAGLNAVDFVLGSGNAGGNKSVDIARVIKLNTFPGYEAIAAIFSGQHPERWMTGDDFCLDFDSLPTNCTATNNPTFNPSEDGPIAMRFHGVNVPDITLNITNRRVA